MRKKKREYTDFVNDKALAAAFDMIFKNDQFYVSIKNNISDLTTISISDIDNDNYKRRFDRMYYVECGVIILPLYSCISFDFELKKKSGVFKETKLKTLTDDVSLAKQQVEKSRQQFPELYHHMIKLACPYSKIIFHHVFSIDPTYKEERSVTINANGLSYKIIKF